MKLKGIIVEYDDGRVETIKMDYDVCVYSMERNQKIGGGVSKASVVPGTQKRCLVQAWSGCKSYDDYKQTDFVDLPFFKKAEA